MRRLVEFVALGLVLVGSGAATAQMIDPSTGVMVDPTTDPSDFANVASGQPGNIGMELAAQATAQAQAMATQQAQAAMQATMQASSPFAADDDARATSVVTRTQKPVITPNGGRFQASVQVGISDKDAQALIHYTIDGSKPTQASPLYVGPLTVTGKTKVRAVAAAATELPSSVVTKTFKVKS